ncbi:protein transport protein sft2 [Entomortierella lignicola]|nr:protein transport protein sft2 [Entomortierella lignicola]
MTTNTESNFRAAFQSFGARGGVSATDDAANSGSGSGSAFDRASSWFGGVRNQVAGYVPVSLGGGGGQPQEEDWLGLTWFQRMAGFALCVAGGLPLFVISPSKFATSFTLGSILMMTSFALLRGPMAHIKALITRERLPFTVAYLGSMVFTLYASLIANSFILTIIGTIIEILALIYYFTSYSPFSARTARSLSFGTSLLPL